MPTPMMKKYADEAGCSLEHVEKLWAQAKDIAGEKFKKRDGHFWAYVNSIVRKGLKLKESMTFKEFIELELSNEPGPEIPGDEAIPNEECPVHAQLATLVKSLFTARDAAHIVHLATDSYAAHKALNELYDALVDHADSIAEAAQGKYSVLDIEHADSVAFDMTSPQALVGSLVQWLENEARCMVPANDTYLLNLLDSVFETVYSASYKINQLR